MRNDFGQRVIRAAGAFPAGSRPRTAIVLGSGLSGIAESLRWRELPFSSFPEFPKATVQGHRGSFFLSERAIVMAGRFHFYEGHAMDDVVLPIFALREIGVETIVLTNAAGGVNPSFAPGDLVLIKDHINYMGANPLVGPNPNRPAAAAAGAGAAGTPFGPRFFDMSETYSKELRETAHAAARRVPELSGKDLAEGVYCAFTGPSYETPAEVRMARTMGADLVGMSTVPEAIAARYLGMRVLGISCVTNLAAGMTDIPLDHAEVVATGKRVESALRGLILELLDRI